MRLGITVRIFEQRGSLYSGNREAIFAATNSLRKIKGSGVAVWMNRPFIHPRPKWRLVIWARNMGLAWRWGPGDWAIRSVSLWGQGKVMKSGGEPSSSLKHKFSKRLHGLLGRWALSFLVREFEELCVCVCARLRACLCVCAKCSGRQCGIWLVAHDQG